MWWRTPWLRQRWLMLSLALCDALLLIGSYNLLFWHSFGRWAGLTGSIGTLSLLWLIASYLLGRYSRPDLGQRDSHRRRLATTFLVGALVLGLVVVVVSWGLKLDDPRTFRSFVLPVLSFATMCSAMAQLWVTSHQTRPRNWLLVGSSRELGILEEELINYPSSSQLSISLYASTNLGKVALSSDQQVDGIAVSELCTLEDGVIEDLLARRGRGVVVYSLVSWCEQHLQRVPPELFSSRWLVQAEGFELQPGRWGWRVKRMGDVVIAATLLLATTPIVLLAALAIRLEDGGSVLYSQIRTGLYGEPFQIWKLRSMRQQAEQRGAQWAGRGDPRITRVGQWLRLLRLDELPQLVAVLRGEMSLIGPRPERPELEVELEEQIPHYRVRHWIRPGLSGWAQVCFPYGASVADSRLKLSYDLYYLRNASLLLDLLILIKTIRLVSRGQGAQPRQDRPPREITTRPSRTN
jgi:exopolysaccharide biosynthesis polyprenyl glycosylphosphotransferase